MKTYFKLLTLASVCFMPAVLPAGEPLSDDGIISRRSPIQQPYEYINGGALSGPTVIDSPDPLVNYVWDNPKAIRCRFSSPIRRVP